MCSYEVTNHIPPHFACMPPNAAPYHQNDTFIVIFNIVVSSCVSSKGKKSLQEKVQEIERATAEMIKEAERSENMEKIYLANDKIKNTREQEVMQGQNFVSSFKGIGCYNSSLYALEHERVLTMAALQESFKASVEESLPDWEDAAISRVFLYTGSEFES